MPTTPPLLAPGAAAPGPERRPRFVRQNSSVRFGGAELIVAVPDRPTFTRLQSEASKRIPSPLNDETPRDTTLTRAHRPTPRILGVATNYKPLWLFAMGTAGNWLYGTGTLALERGLFPRRPIAPPGQSSPRLPPVYQPIFGSKSASIGLGISSTLGGVFLAVLASTLAYQDSRRLSLRLNPNYPSYRRPNIYYGIHLAAILVSVGAKFMADALRDNIERDLTWAAAFPMWLGQAAFAVTQAQAFSNVEIYNGKMRIKHRTALGFAARSVMGIYALLGVMQTISYFNAYVKEIVRLIAQSSTALAFALPLTTARIQRHYAPGETPVAQKPSWHALEVMMLYIAGRFMAGFGPDLLQSGVLPQPNESHKPGDLVGKSFGGAAMLAAGTALCVTAIMFYREDVGAYDKKQANLLAAGAVGALLAIEVYRSIFETSIATKNRSLVWIAVVPGMIGFGLRLAILPVLFSFSELRRGDIPLPKRYHWTEACRALGNMGLGIWISMLAVPGFNSYIREFVGVTAGVLATLGMALPTTTSKRAMSRYDYPLSPGETPVAIFEGRTFFPFELTSIRNGTERPNVG